MVFRMPTRATAAFPALAAAALVLALPTTGAVAGDAAAIIAVDPVPLEFAEFNAAIDAAAAAGETWVRDPLAVLSRRFANGSGEVSWSMDVSIVRTDTREEPGSLRATVVEEGLRDDSMAGVWASVDLVRGPDGAWRIAADLRAERCARGADTVTWSGRPCP